MHFKLAVEVTAFAQVQRQRATRARCEMQAKIFNLYLSSTFVRSGSASMFTTIQNEHKYKLKLHCSMY